MVYLVYLYGKMEKSNIKKNILKSNKRTKTILFTINIYSIECLLIVLVICILKPPDTLNETIFYNCL